MASPLDPHAAIVTEAVGIDVPLTTADGQPLKKALIRASRRARWRSCRMASGAIWGW